MTRARIPVVATLVVLVAVGIMVGLGFWQLDRLAQKEALLARYAAAQSMSSEVSWPRTEAERQDAMFRHSSVKCRDPVVQSAKAGYSDRGVLGWTHIVRCPLAEGGFANVAFGWTPHPPVEQTLPEGAHGFRWSSQGPIRGVIGPFGKSDVILVASPPVSPAMANASPDPRDIPNNHLAYAVQWFLFAGVALVIYGLALRKRLRGK